jgi:hypothetical protein
MSIGPLGKAGQQEPAVTQEMVTGISITRGTFAMLVMLLGLILAPLGAGYAWGWAYGLFTAGIMISVYGVLLGIGN